MPLGTKNDLPEKDVNVDALGEIINPATKENQTLILSELQLIKANQTNKTQSARLLDGAGNEINSFRGALNVHDADTHRSVINSKFHFDDGILTTTLSAPATAGSSSITLTSVVGLTTGMRLHLDSWMIYPRVIAINGSVVTISTPLDFNLPIGTPAHTVIIDMYAQNGSIVAPKSFKVTPVPGQIWHILRIMISITDGTAMDDGLFGALAALTNGCVLRRYDGASGTFGTFTNWRSNQDMRLDMFDLTYTTRSGGQGSYGLCAQGAFKDIGSIVYLDAAAGDYLEILIQDNLTGLDSFMITAQGHQEGV